MQSRDVTCAIGTIRTPQGVSMSRAVYPVATSRKRGVFSNSPARKTPGNENLSLLSDKTTPALEGVPETLLIPLWARAQEQQHADPILVDPESVRIVEQLNYDFDNFRRKNVETENFCVRARVMDDLIASILLARPGRTVVEFGPGLDTRSHRLGHFANRWLEVDLPEVIDLRRQFFTETDNCSMLGCSMTDSAWKDVLSESDGAPLFIAEGVFYFFSQEQIRTFVGELKDSFPGGDLVFDAISSWFLTFSNMRHPLSSSRMQFSLQPMAKEITSWDPDLSINEYIGYGDSPWYDAVMHRFSWWKRAAVKFIPPARHAFMVVHTGLDTGARK